jgi:hypothetical protein
MAVIWNLLLRVIFNQNKILSTRRFLRYRKREIAKKNFCLSTLFNALFYA